MATAAAPARAPPPLCKQGGSDKYQAGDIPQWRRALCGGLSVSEEPGARSPLPAVVMGHSVHMVKEALAPSTQYLLEAGFVVLAIDYRAVDRAGPGAMPRSLN
jgi:hypothetical protein